MNEMINDELQKLGQAGEELDALVAERVMKWKANRKRNRWESNGGEFQRFIYFDSESISEPFAPSEEIDSAWEVVERVRKNGFSAHIDNMNNGHIWTCIFYRGDLGRNIEGYADTAPLAICRAALLAPLGD